jgi:hypothetical protein
VSSEPDIDPRIEEIARDLLDEYDQPENFKNRFIKFYENITENNYDRNSVERLIENIELPEEEKIDEP